MELKGRKKIVHLDTAIHDIFVYSMEVCLLFYIPSVLNLDVLKNVMIKEKLWTKCNQKKGRSQTKSKQNYLDC